MNREIILIIYTELRMNFKNSCIKFNTNILIAFFLLFFLFCPTHAAGPVMQPGEELEYEVSFWGIKLGTIKIVTLDNVSMNSKEVFHVVCNIDAYTGIPFIEIHAKFEGWIDPTVSYSHKFAGNSKFMSDQWDFQKITYDYANSKILNEKYSGKNRLYYDSIKTIKKWNDGCSLFFFARQFTKLGKNIIVPTIMNRDTTSTNLNFTGKTTATEIDAVNYPVKTVHFTGKANWEGVYGLSGEFEGWFSDDDARVPIRAKMNVYVGSINVELVKWKRAGWMPPKG